MSTSAGLAVVRQQFPGDGSHVLHGGWSFFQTWGWDSPDRNRFLRGVGWVLALGIAVGFALVPLMFMAGVMPVPPG